MKLLFTSLMVLFALATFSQEEKKQGMTGYLKISAELYFSQGNNISPLSAAFIGGGAIFGNYVALGGDVGLYKLRGYKGPFVPLGGQLSVGNFKARKISPIIQFGCYYPYYKDTETGSFNSGTSVVNVSTETRGSFQVKANGGITVASGENARIILAAGFSQINVSSTVTTSVVSSSDQQTTITKGKGRNQFYTVSFTFMFD